MNNFREVNDDIIKEWLEFRKETAFYNMTSQDKNIIHVLMNWLKKF